MFKDAIQFYSVADNDVNEDINIYRVVLYRENNAIPQASEPISLDFSFLANYSIYPNPSNEYVDIDLEGVRYREVELSIFNSVGIIVKQLKVEKAPIAPVRMQLDGLENGQYLIHIKAEGKREVVKKLTIMH
jgi:hypothetical protein